METTKVMLVFGTRPEAIKMAMLIKEFNKYPDRFETIVCTTGQHFHMLNQILDSFEIEPSFELSIMKAKQDLYDITSRVLVKLRDVLSEVNPDIVLVQGDTTTALASALAAFYQKIPVGHIEAGLRTHDINNPWPEEMNRLLISRIAAINFAPTDLNKENLISEGIFEEKISVTGNTGIDALYFAIDMIQTNEEVRSELDTKLAIAGYDINRICQNKQLVLITSHRRENLGESFINICNAINTLTDKHPDVDFVFPMHMNPNVRIPLHQLCGGNTNTNLFLTETLDYFAFVYLMHKASVILTDSGGIQEEAPSLGKPVLVMRNVTERQEIINTGCCKLVGTEAHQIVNEVSLLLTNENQHSLMSNVNNYYGDGKASEKIVNRLIEIS